MQEFLYNPKNKPDYIIQPSKVETEEPEEIKQEVKTLDQYELNKQILRSHIVKSDIIFDFKTFNSNPNNSVIYHEPKGSFYRGEVNNSGSPHGIGIMIYLRGQIYEGEWLNGKREGLGHYIMGKSSYFGQFKNNAPNGTGVENKKEGIYNG
jgi:hypothetical protein